MMKLEQAKIVAQQCADACGLWQAVTIDEHGEYFVFTCPPEIDEGITEVIAPSWEVYWEV
jgi:hypothetical protein